MNDDQQHAPPDFEVEPEQQHQISPVAQAPAQFQPFVVAVGDVEQKRQHHAAAQHQRDDAEQPPKDHHAGASSASPAGASDASSKVMISKLPASASTARTSRLFSAWPDLNAV